MEKQGIGARGSCQLKRKKYYVVTKELSHVNNLGCFIFDFFLRMSHFDRIPIISSF